MTMHFSQLVAALATAVLLFLAQPPVGAWWLAWIAFTPLIFVCLQVGSARAFILGFVAGFVGKSMATYWIFEISTFSAVHLLMLGSYWAVYPGLWCSIIPLFARGKGLLLLAPAAWVLLDFVIANAGFLAFPWGTLAHTQHQNLPIIQIATIAGEYGVTFLVMMMSVAVAQACRFRNRGALGIALLSVGMAHVWGWLELNRGQSGYPVTVAAVQPAMAGPTGPPQIWNATALDTLERFTVEAAEHGAELIIWPESSIRRWKGESEVIPRIKDMARSLQTPILVGASENRKFVQQARIDTRVADRRYNAAFLVRPDGSIPPSYYKNRLLPFVEYTPLTDFISWPSWLVPDSVGLDRGTRPRSYAINDAVYVSPIICWENIFTDLVRRNVSQEPVIISHISNLSDFGRTAASRQHNSASVLRAVENRSPVVVASNTGPSQVIDAFGRVVAEVPNIDSAGVAVGEVQAYRGRTFYSEYGYAFILILTVVLGAAAAALAKRLR